MDNGFETRLLDRANLEERNYNWIEAAKLYEKIAKSFLNKEMLENAAKVYKKLGYVNIQASETVDTSDEYKEQKRFAMIAYEKAVNLFRQIKNRSQELECEAEKLNILGVISDSIFEAKTNFNKSCELFIKSSEIYENNNNYKGMTRTLSRGAIVSCDIIRYCSDPIEIEEVYQKCVNIADKSWKLSMKIGNIESLAESLIAEGWISYIRPYIIDFVQEKHWEEYFKKYLIKCDKSLEYIENFTDFKIIGEISLASGGWYCYYGVFIEDRNEQQKLINKGLELLEKAFLFASKIKYKSLMIYSLFWINWFALLGGRFEYIQKRIFKDVRKIIKLGKIYEGLFSNQRFFANLLPANYYTNFAQRSFITPTQRKSYAEKGIEFANEALKSNSFLPYSAWIYQILTSTYSQLVMLTSSKEEHNEYIEKMLQYAKMAENISEKYEGGYTKAAGYSCLYRAYKTLTDNAQSEEEKIKMLSTTIDALEKYIIHEMESRGRIIAAQIRLGTLYQELGIISRDINIILKAKELFFHIIKESLEKGYYYYIAAAHEYIAHIEDRMGNYSVSAEHYRDALETHLKSLENIEYIPLKNKIKEKANYSRAWNLIEKAKAYHKKEEHLKAKKSYEDACKILETLQRFNYEAIYYSSWAFQEEAEQYSKQEHHEEAIKKYKVTKINFQRAKDLLENTFKTSSDKEIKERIEKLKKVADVRINYCSARIDLEKARILGKKGKNLTAAEKYASAASKFRDVCLLFRIEREKDELKAVYYLCKAWESMELAEKYEAPKRFKEAANLFISASQLFAESKLKFLASGNSSFCLALEHGCKFDAFHEIGIKAELYTKVKSLLRNAANSYEKGGFKSGADWALATSTYFDAIWHLIRADKELEISIKKDFLNIGSNYLKSAALLFGESGYKEKEKEVLERLNRVLREERILISALNTIKKPSLSGSIEGIIAPACSIETSQSPRISEIRQLSEERSRVISVKEVEKKYEIIYKDLLKEYPKIQRRVCRIGIAQIGLSETGDLINEFYEIKTSGLLGLHDDKVKPLKSTVKNMVEKAHSDGVNILVFPELTIDLNYEHWLEDLSNFTKVYDMYIIPGSYHDQTTKLNLSRVIGYDGILWEQEKHIPAMIQLGKKRFKEAIESSAPPKKTIVCNTEFGRIAIVICRDFLDMDLRVELKNFEPPVDIVINPAFTPVTADFKAAHFDARRSIYAYCFFANVAEFGESLIYTPEKDRTERMIPAKEEGLIYKDVDIFKLRSERKRWEKVQKKEKKFIQSTR